MIEIIKKSRGRCKLYFMQSSFLSSFESKVLLLYINLKTLLKVYQQLFVKTAMICLVTYHVSHFQVNMYHSSCRHGYLWPLCPFHTPVVGLNKSHELSIPIYISYPFLGLTFIFTIRTGLLLR